MGILKALAFGHFKLPCLVLRSLYKSLIRSVMEYSSIIVNLINAKSINRLQIIQNNCLRIICKKDRSTLIEELHECANVSMVEVRLKKMSRKYIASNIITNNPLVKTLANDYVEFVNECNNRNAQVSASILKSNEDLFTNDNAWLIEADESDN